MKVFSVYQEPLMAAVVTVAALTVMAQPYAVMVMVESCTAMAAAAVAAAGPTEVVARSSVGETVTTPSKIPED